MSEKLPVLEIVGLSALWLAVLLKTYYYNKENELSIFANPHEQENKILSCLFTTKWLSVKEIRILLNKKYGINVEMKDIGTLFTILGILEKKHCHP